MKLAEFLSKHQQIKNKEIAAVKSSAQLPNYGLIVLAPAQAHSVYFRFHGYLLGSRTSQVGVFSRQNFLWKKNCFTERKCTVFQSEVSTSFLSRWIIHF